MINEKTFIGDLFESVKLFQENESISEVVAFEERIFWDSLGCLVINWSLISKWWDVKKSQRIKPIRLIASDELDQVQWR